MVTQGNKSQRKGQENSPEDEINEIQLSKLSEGRFIALISRKLNTMNKERETLKTHQVAIKNDIAERKNTSGGLTGRGDEAEDRIGELKDRVQNNQGGNQKVKNRSNSRKTA